MRNAGRMSDPIGLLPPRISPPPPPNWHPFSLPVATHLPCLGGQFGLVAGDDLLEALAVLLADAGELGLEILLHGPELTVALHVELVLESGPVR